MGKNKLFDEFKVDVVLGESLDDLCVLEREAGRQNASFTCITIHSHQWYRKVLTVILTQKSCNSI